MYHGVCMFLVKLHCVDSDAEQRVWRLGEGTRHERGWPVHDTSSR